MSDRPDAADLLATARSAVLDVLLPALPPEHHYTARMVANAIAIAAREVAALPLDGALATALGDLAALDSPAPADAIGCALADRIRGGIFDDDPAARRRLHAALTAWTAARLAVANPKAVRA